MDDYAIVKITKCAEKFEYFNNFNRKTGVTACDMEGNNNVLITRIPSSSTYQNSQLIAILDEGENM